MADMQDLIASGSHAKLATHIAKSGRLPNMVCGGGFCRSNSRRKTQRVHFPNLLSFSLMTFSSKIFSFQLNERSRGADTFLAWNKNSVIHSLSITYKESFIIFLKVDKK